MNTNIKLIKNRYAGLVFGRLTILDEMAEYERDSERTYLTCLCECGSRKRMRSDGIVSGKTRSCGCLKIEHSRKLGKSKATHGKRHTRLYTTWVNMRCRCQKEYRHDYERYGGKGISVCSEWSNFNVFHNWAVENGYSDNLTIDRINPNGNYCPENCRWLTPSDNSKAKARMIKRNDGKVFLNIHDMASFYSIDTNAVYKSIYRQTSICGNYLHEFVNP